MFVVTYRKIFYAISSILVVASLVGIGLWGFNVGIDFKGGSILEVSYPGTRPTMEAVNPELAKLGLGDYSLRPTGTDGYALRMKEITPAEKSTVEAALSGNGASPLVEKQFSSIGPVLGQESQNKAFMAIALVILAIVLFIAFAFRTVSRPVSSWVYGIVAIVALIHDVIVPTGVFVFLGHFHGVEIDTLFVTALLVILGFSIHDTIVVFDRVRENLKHAPAKKTFEHIVGESISQTFTRSINTSLTVLLSLLVLYFVGPDATRNFVLALLVGIVAGTYSSIFIGSPLLVTIERWQNRAR